MNNPAGPSGAQRARWGATVGTAVTLQWLIVLVLAAAAWIWKGEAAGGSLFYGGAAVALPNVLLALWLTLRVRRAGGAGVVAMFAGELLKLCGTVALLLVVVETKPLLSWPALIVGVIAALKAQWLALWVTRRF